MKDISILHGFEISSNYVFRYLAVKNYADNPKKFLDSYSDKELCSFTCDEILIMRSELTPKGAIHTVLERVSL